MEWIGLDWVEDRGGGWVWQGAVPAAPAAPRRRVRRACVVGLSTGGGSWGWRAPRFARVSGLSGWVWLLTPARRNAPLGSACAAVTALEGDRPHTLFLGRVAPGGGAGPGVSPAPLDPVGRRPAGVLLVGDPALLQDPPPEALMLMPSGSSSESRIKDRD